MPAAVLWPAGRVYHTVIMINEWNNLSEEVIANKSLAGLKKT